MPLPQLGEALGRGLRGVLRTAVSPRLQPLVQLGAELVLPLECCPLPALSESPCELLSVALSTSLSVQEPLVCCSVLASGHVHK